jgi:hypothetical protein
MKKGQLMLAMCGAEDTVSLVLFAFGYTLECGAHIHGITRAGPITTH